MAGLFLLLTLQGGRAERRREEVTLAFSQECCVATYGLLSYLINFTLKNIRAIWLTC